MTDETKQPEAQADATPIAPQGEAADVAGTEPALTDGAETAEPAAAEAQAETPEPEAETAESATPEPAAASVETGNDAAEPAAEVAAPVAATADETRDRYRSCRARGTRR